MTYNETKAINLLPNERKELIKAIVCSSCSNITDEEFKLFLYICDRVKLDPLGKQIYAIRRGGRMTIQTAIDGFRLIADRTGNYSAGKSPTYEYDENHHLINATAYIKKRTPDGCWHEISSTAYWKEYAQEGSFWKKMPHLMLAKCAESLVLRKAFPAELSGLYTEEEMGQEKEETLDVQQVAQIRENANEERIQRLCKVYDVNKLEDIKKSNFNVIYKSITYPKQKGLVAQ